MQLFCGLTYYKIKQTLCLNSYGFSEFDNQLIEKDHIMKKKCFV